MNIRFLLLFFLLFFGIIAPSFFVLAHDGIPFEADGCHECRAEDGCFFFDYWSVPRVTRHCHVAEAPVSATTSVAVSLDTKNTTSSSKKEEENQIRVIHVLSGDEVQVELGNGDRALIQLLGVQNPAEYETDLSSVCREKMEEEAVRRLEDLALYKKVELQASLRGEDALQDGTLLRAIFRGKKFINAEMLQDGYAMTDEEHAFEFLPEFSRAETSARESERGVWDSEFCAEKKNRLLGMLLAQISHYRSLPGVFQYAFAALGILGIYFFGRLIRRSRVMA